MPLGIVSEEEFKQELDRNLPKVIPVIVPQNVGRGNTPEVPESLRKIVGEDSVNGATGKELAKAYGVSESSVSAYKNGATSTASYNNPNRELKSHIDHVRERITRRASKSLTKALTSLEEEDFDAIKARDKAGIAKDMSVIIKNMQPEVAPQNHNNVNFVVFAPKQKEEQDYDVIEVVE